MKALLNRYKSGGPLAHYLISAGGSRAILAGCGSVFACHLAGLEFESIGGVSGGSLPAVLYASGMSTARLLECALDVDFRDKCVSTAGKWETMLAIIMKEYHEHPENRNAYGVMETGKLAEYIDALVPTWPEKFWTMAVDGDKQIVFNKKGIFEYAADGKCTQLASDPGKVGFAIQATCAIPGITKPPRLGKRYLYDGAFSKYGICPVGLPIAHFGIKPWQIIGMSVGEDKIKGMIGFVRKLWQKAWGIKPDTSWGSHTEGVLDIHPMVEHIHALRFDLSSDEKWLAILDGFNKTVLELAAAGLLKGEKLHKALILLSSLPKLKDAVFAEIGKPQLLAEKAEQCFIEHGLL